MIVTLSSIGLPLTNGFVGEFLILLGAFEANPVYGVFAAIGRRSGRLLHALDVPAGDLRQSHQSGKREADRPDCPRERFILIPLVVFDLLDRHLSVTVSRSDRAGGEQSVDTSRSAAQNADATGNSSDTSLPTMIPTAGSVIPTSGGEQMSER